VTSIVQVTNTWWPVNEASDSVCTCLHKHLMEKLTKSYPEDTSEEQLKQAKMKVKINIQSLIPVVVQK